MARVLRHRSIPTITQQLRGLGWGVPDELASVLVAIAKGTKSVSRALRGAPLRGTLGSAGLSNSRKDDVQKMDLRANEILKRNLLRCRSVAGVGSEEDQYIQSSSQLLGAKCIVFMDPLDGSSNLGFGGMVGSIFSVFHIPDVGHLSLDSFALQPGRNQVAACYAVYGSSTELVMTTGVGVAGFTLDPVSDDFRLSRSEIRTPQKGTVYSVNEAHADRFPVEYSEYISRTKNCSARSSLRYFGSFVADLHRTILTGGVFLYPPTLKHPKGKLSLLYEANPLAFILEQSGGGAFSGSDRILDITPEELHQTIPVVFGGKQEMAEFFHCYHRVQSVTDGNAGRTPPDVLHMPVN